jgi:RNA polymerase sigma-70 factor (ECF subfamily)
MTGGGNSPLAIELVDKNLADKPGGIEERVLALYQAHRENIYRFLVGQGLKPSNAQEVTQDVFVDLYIALGKGADVKSEQAWLYTVAGRAAVDYWRREGRVKWVELDAVKNAAASGSTQLNPEAETGRRERMAQVASSLARLPKEQRLCIHLRMQGLRYREIAKILRVSTSTAAEWLASAVERLRGEHHA